ncbi:MAG TPA: diacylglycerol kinase family protein [Jatrophihabitantaceae bacterium]
MTAAQRWLARLALAALVAAVVVLLVGGTKSVVAIVAAVLGVALALAGAWWFLSRHGAARMLGGCLAVVAVAAVIAVYVSQHALRSVLVFVGLLIVAVVAGRAAMTRPHPATDPAERVTPPPQHPYLIMNPRSGGGKVGRFELDRKATSLGADVALLDGPGHVDVAALARSAVANGSDLLGVAGGDGTQALVAGIAAEHRLPFLVIAAGTRNHFAMDLGLDRERPDRGLDALTDGVEVCLDLGRIGDRTFVNNASFGAYAAIVQSPAYRDDKRGTTLDMLPELLTGDRGPRLTVRIDDDLVIEAPQAVLVSNNPYDFGDIGGLGRRPRLDAGVLGVIAVTVNSAVQAATLLRAGRGGGVRQLVAHRVVVDADVDEIPVGIDGESIMMPTPVECTIQPQALRVRVPQTRPGVPAAKPHIDTSVLLRQALNIPTLTRR